MSLGITAIVDAVKSHAQSLGVFDVVNTHEPANAPGHGLVAAIWFDRVAPAARASGLTSTTALVVLNVRITTNTAQEPADDIDTRLVDALDQLLAAYSGDFELGGNVRNVDLLGHTGVSLEARAGYLEVGDQTHRAIVITLPVVVNDAWTQAP